MATLKDLESLAEYLEEAYVSKYAKYLDDDDDDDNEEDDDEEEPTSKFNSKKSEVKNTSSKDIEKRDDKKKEVPTIPSYLSTEELLKIRNIAVIVLHKYPKLKKCCDYIDLKDKDHINDDGERESELDKYYNSGNPKSFVKLIDGDVFSGYPNFRSGGNEAYEKDAKAFTKEMNETLEDRGIKAKWCTGPDKEDEAISFGVRSTKTKIKK